MPEVTSPLTSSLTNNPASQAWTGSPLVWCARAIFGVCDLRGLGFRACWSDTQLVFPKATAGAEGFTYKSFSPGLSQKNAAAFLQKLPELYKERGGSIQRLMVALQGLGFMWF